MVKKTILITIAVFLILNQLEETLNANIPTMIQWIIAIGILAYVYFSNGGKLR